MSRLLTALLVFVFFTIVLGSWVRNAGAGLSCPDWPLCHGHIIPPMEYRIMLEYFHRLAAALVGILLLSAFIWAMAKKNLRPHLGKWLSLALAVLFLQILLGKWTVDHLLQWEVVAMHLGCAVIFLTCVLIATLKARRLEAGSAQKPVAIRSAFFWTARLAALVVFVQILLGGSVSSHYAGLACPDFPTCHGDWFPGFSGQVGIQFIHRIGAVFATLAILAFLYQWRPFRGNPPALWAGFPCLMGGLLGMQWLLGIGMIYWGVANSMTIPAPFSVAHLAIGVVIFVLLISANYEFHARKLS